ncbi:excalibur calcium-binding domain-containing protein [Kitasatospora sp. NPDC056446]|uniref:excalibur calcium-binding domain-containing protein n=1 Tax=Kitasatospora sp. NPDC056446 TaxID=3345819 RepID=UPI0036BEAAD4
MTHDSFRPSPARTLPPRTPANRLVRAAALLFVPPVAAVWLWRSRRLPKAAKVALTVFCVLGTFYWIGVLTGPPKKDQPVAAPAATPTTAATTTPAAAPAPAETPAPTATPVATGTPHPIVMPEVGGRTAADARTLLLVAGIATDRVHEVSRYQDLPLPAEHAAWTACATELPPGSPLSPATETTLRLVRPGATCPADGQQALYADERNDPASPTHQGASTGTGTGAGTGGTGGGSTGSTGGGTSGGSSGTTTGGTSGGSSGGASGGEGGSGGGSAYYKNCTEVKAAGKAPLHRGDPGYRAGLDRDNDGVACER